MHPTCKNVQKLGLDFGRMDKHLDSKPSCLKTEKSFSRLRNW